MLRTNLEGKNIVGEYLGVPFSGTIILEDNGGLFGTAFYVRLDPKITVYGTERESVVVYRGRDNFQILN